MVTGPPASRRDRLRCALALAALLCGPAAARAAAPDGGRARRGGGDDLSVVIARTGLVTRVRFEGTKLVAREAGGSEVASRVLAAGERGELLEAARSALDDDAPQWTCPVDPTWMTATVDGRTTTSAFCPERNHWRAHPDLWRRLLALVRRLLAV